MEVDIFIDVLTDCLIERKTGEKVETFMVIFEDAAKVLIDKYIKK